MQTYARSIVARNAEETFFAMMLTGYAKEVSPRIVQRIGRPSEKVYTYTNPNNEWWGEDRYVVSDESAYSYGQTVIGCGNTPIWTMQYWGIYPEEAIPTLKAGLSWQYEQRAFNGGRGPKIFRSDDNSQCYFNEGAGNFKRFVGKEEVYLMTKIGRERVLGWHEYHGGLLL